LTPKVKNLSDQVKAKAAGDADKGGAWIVRQERIAAFRIARIEMDGHGCAVAFFALAFAVECPRSLRVIVLPEL